MGIKPFSQCSQIKVKLKEMAALLIDFSFAPLGLAMQEGHMCKKLVHQMRISQASVFLVVRSHRTPSLLSFYLMVYPHPPREIESSMVQVHCCRCSHASGCKQPFKCRWGGSFSHPKSFMLAQQLAAVTQNRCLKWDSSLLVFCLFIHQGHAPVPQHHLVTLWPSSLLSVAAGLRFSWHGGELRLLTGLSLSWPLSLTFRRSGGAGNSLTQESLWGHSCYNAQGNAQSP